MTLKDFLDGSTCLAVDNLDRPKAYADINLYDLQAYDAIIATRKSLIQSYGNDKGINR